MNINTSYTAGASNNQNRIDYKGQSAIKSTNEVMTESDRRMKILDEKYEKINEQNKRFENPHGHIHDKYRNPRSPYFRSDLTKVEREAAYTMEIGWANSGKGGQYDFNDAIFRNEKRYDPTQESVEKKYSIVKRSTNNYKIYSLKTV